MSGDKKKSNPFLDQIRAARDENSIDELRDYTVPEWSTKEKPFIIYYRNFNLDDVDYVARMSQGSKGKSLAHTIIRKALKEDGTKMFSNADIFFFTKKVESNTVVNIVNAMNRVHQGVDYEGE